MRKIEKEMLAAVRERKNWSCGNTRVSVADNVVRVLLHGNCIYSVNGNCKSFTLAGWVSNTTMSRLRALGVDVCRKDYNPMCEGREIDSTKWYNVS